MDMHICIHIHALSLEPIVHMSLEDIVLVGSHDTMLVPLRLHQKYGFG
jgi:hypothetical protein